VSVRLSVPSIDHCGGFAAERPAGEQEMSIDGGDRRAAAQHAARRTPAYAGSATLSADAPISTR